jgi:cytochrome b
VSTDSESDGAPATRRVTVWDAATRVFHWLIVVLIAFAWWTYKQDRMEWHRITGYAVIALLVFRVWWGIAGPETARFAAFVKGPAHAWRYVRGQVQHTIGHNPIGGWSVVALLLVLIVQTASGLFASDEEGLESGPLTSLVTYGQSTLAAQWHEMAFNVLLGLAALHIVAIVFYAATGNNLIGPMITGGKHVPEHVEPPRMARWWAWAVGLALLAGTFAAMMWVDGG